MENAGLITYVQNLMLCDPALDSINRQRGYAEIVAHEMAHEWFGDLVTTAWWNDIWLNEAFATWMEQKLIAEWKPEWKTRIGDVSSKLGAERTDSLISSRKIRQEIQTKDDISNAFDGITYQKGASVLGVRAGEAVRRNPALGEERMKALSAWAEAGKILPNISHRLPLEEWAAGMRLLVDRKAIGRVALMMR